MKNGRRMIAGGLYIALGAVLFGLGAAEIVDAFWSGMGGALMAVGIIRTVQLLRYSKDEAYREARQIEAKDERSQFIRNKAWAWAGYLFVLIAAVAAIVCRVLGKELLSMAAGFAVCILMLLYWLCVLALNKKY